MIKNNSVKTSDVMDYLSNIEDINCGGCGIAALVLYEMFKKEGKNPKILYFYLYYGDPNYKINKEFIKGNTDIAGSAYHIVVEVDGRFYDCEGEYDIDAMGIWEKHYVTKDHLINSLTHGGWNDTFDRKKYYPKIKKYLKMDVDLPLEYKGAGHYYW